jgi:hypothetical protein
LWTTKKADPESGIDLRILDGQAVVTEWIRDRRLRSRASAPAGRSYGRAAGMKPIDQARSNPRSMNCNSRGP